MSTANTTSLLQRVVATNAGWSALAPPAARLPQSIGQCLVVRVKAQSHNMHGLVNESDGNFGPGQITHTAGLGCGSSPMLATNFIVIGQRPQLHAVAVRPFGQCLRREGTVRDDGVAVEVSIQYGVHRCILPAPSHTLHT